MVTGWVVAWANDRTMPVLTKSNRRNVYFFIIVYINIVDGKI